jgi:SAM-dependent methyltransferase
MEDNTSKEESILDLDFSYQSLHPLPHLKHPSNIGSLKIPTEDGSYVLEHSNKAALGGLNPFSPKFESLGLKYLRLMIEHSGLRPDHKILDVGCGTGRIAKVLQGFLDNGKYDGFDVNEHFVDYCKSSIVDKKFDFRFCNVQNDEYNPAGDISPEAFEFPYGDRSFDRVCAIGVFNHLELPWAFQYVREITRVLKPKGIFFGTFFLLNGISMPYVRNKENHPLKFEIETDDVWYEYKDRPLFNVALSEQPIRRVFIKSGLMIKEPIKYGHWCGFKNAIVGHDVIVAIKGQWK